MLFYDHYRPVGLEDPIPRNLTGCAVALADKLDSVVGCFAVGVVPTGSSDPTLCAAPPWEWSRSFWRRSCPSHSL